MSDQSEPDFPAQILLEPCFNGVTVQDLNGHLPLNVANWKMSDKEIVIELKKRLSTSERLRKDYAHKYQQLFVRYENLKNEYLKAVRRGNEAQILLLQNAQNQLKVEIENSREKK